MGNCVDKIEHSCGTRSGLQVFEEKDGSYNGFCFSCRTYVDDPYQNRPEGYKPPKPEVKSQEEIDEEIKLIESCQTLDLPERRLEAEYLEYFGVKVGVSADDASKPSSAFFPYFNGEGQKVYKARVFEGKKMWAVGSAKDLEPFGWREAKVSGARNLIITEGEFDAVSVFQALKEMNKHNPQYASLNPAVISLPNGASSAKKTISTLLPEIRKRFHKVTLCFDMDEPGRKAVDEAVKLIPTANVVDLPEKDANDCLLAGKQKALARAVNFQGVSVKNTRLVKGEDLHEEAREQAPWGVSWPWKQVTHLTRGIRTGETYYFGAAQKMGKSELVNAIAAHLIKEHQWKIMLAKPEEANKKSYKMLASKVVGKIFHDPQIEFDYDAYDKAGEILRGKVLLVDLYQHLGWDTLKDDIVDAATQGCKAVFIDPITNLTNGMSSSDINTTLQGVAQELAALAKDLDIAIFIFCHLNKPPKGAVPHDRGGRITTDQFAGSSAMGRSCNYMFGFEGNKDPDLAEAQRNLRDLVLLDDREYGEVGRVGLFWDKHTSLFNEVRK